MHNLVLSVGLGMVCRGGCRQAMWRSQIMSSADDAVIRCRVMNVSI